MINEIIDEVSPKNTRTKNKHLYSQVLFYKLQPKVRLFNKLIHASIMQSGPQATRDNMRADALYYFERIKHHNLEPDFHTYATLTRFDLAYFPKAFEMLDQAPLGVYDQLIRSVPLSMAEQIFYKLKENTNLKPDKTVFHAMIRASMLERNSNKAWGYAQELVNSGCSPTVCDGPDNHADYQQYPEMVDIHLWIISHAVKSVQNKCLLRMLHLGAPLERVLEHIKDQNLEPWTPLQIQILSLTMDIEACRKLFGSIPTTLVACNIYLNKILKLAPHLDEIEKVAALFPEIDITSLNTAMEALRAVKQYDQAHAIYDALVTRSRKIVYPFTIPPGKVAINPVTICQAIDTCKIAYKDTNDRSWVDRAKKIYLECPKSITYANCLTSWIECLIVANGHDGVLEAGEILATTTSWEIDKKTWTQFTRYAQDVYQGDLNAYIREIRRRKRKNK